MTLKEKIKSIPFLKRLLIWAISPDETPRPRWWVRLFLFPFYVKKGKGVILRRGSRLDVFPWHKFTMADGAIVESYCTINNGAGDVILGKKSRVGIGSVVIGPVVLEDHVGLGQHVFISGFNHNYKDGERDSNDQGLTKSLIVIGEESHIGSNSVVVAGVKIGKRCQIGAGSVVTKDIPDYSLAVGNPAKVIKRFNLESKTWEMVN